MPAGAGGALTYINNYAVASGITYTVTVGSGGTAPNGSNGAGGAVRIVWPGTRTFPSSAA
jgi:hypothetical protein